jgi:hypothetical protein
LYELSKLDPICERIGAIYGAILLLVGMASSKSENGVAVEKAENTLKNLDKYETNVKQMAENGRLQPLLTKLIQGMQCSYPCCQSICCFFSPIDRDCNTRLNCCRHTSSSGRHG